MSKKTKFVIVALLVAAIALSFGIGYTFGLRHLTSFGEGVSKIEQAWNIILTDYVDRDRINTDNMSKAAIEGMLESLDDPYSSYMEAENFEIGLSSLEGKFNGIGAYVTVQDKKLMIIAPIIGSPAEKAGIKTGDIILEINDESVIDMSLAVAILKIRGPKGTNVKLLILHEGESEPIEIEVTRTEVEVPSIRFWMVEDIAYINITQFSERTEDELSPVLQELMEQNARGIILDLRGNPGGLLDTVVAVASYFLHDVSIVDVVTNQGKVATLMAQKSILSTDLPLVILVDQASASGSEVLAGALQDHSRALVAGNTTYGKGSVNILRKLDDGSGLYITTARWLTPNGRPIEGHGIEPDQKLELTGDDAIQWAVNYLKSRQQ